MRWPQAHVVAPVHLCECRQVLLGELATSRTYSRTRVLTGLQVLLDELDRSAYDVHDLGGALRHESCNPLQPSATLCNPLQPSAAICNPLQPSAAICNPLQPFVRWAATPYMRVAVTLLT